MAKSKQAHTSMATPSKSEDDYRAESDHRTLREAEEVQRDPTRMKRVSVVHRKMMQDLATVGRKLGTRAAKPIRRRRSR